MYIWNLELNGSFILLLNHRQINIFKLDGEINGIWVAWGKSQEQTYCVILCKSNYKINGISKIKKYETL